MPFCRYLDIVSLNEAEYLGKIGTIIRMINKNHSDSLSLKIDRDASNLRDVALEKMRVAILTGYFKSSQRLVERQLCDELGVSRSVIREVIRYLESEGLVEHIPNKGPIVTPLDVESIKQVYEVRALIEVKAGKECALHAQEDTKILLKEALESLNKAYSCNDIIVLINAINKFYKIIFDATKQDVAWDVVQRLNGKISRLRAITLSTKDRHISGYKRMEEIYKNICNNDAEKTAETIKIHLQEASEIAQKSIKKPEKKQDNTKQTKGYWLANVTVTNAKQYKKYTAKTLEILNKYGAKILVRGGDKIQLEGTSENRHVVLEFESVDKALECYNSAEYQEAKKQRDGACIVNITIVEGAETILKESRDG